MAEPQESSPLPPVADAPGSPPVADAPGSPPVADAPGSPDTMAPKAEELGTHPLAYTATSADLQAYRPLSVLALVGFGTSALYAAISLLMAAVALISRKPMPALGWTLVIPVIGLLLCLAARFQIARSEGTLAGRALTGWGLVLGLLVCTAYTAYSWAVHLALRQQSEAYVNEWFELLRQGKVARAFWRTLPPRQRTGLREEDPNLRRKIAERASVEMGMPGGGGLFTHFLKQDLIRAFTTGGPETTFVPNGVKSLDPTPGGYRVVLSYHITTPVNSFDAGIAVECTDGTGSGEGQEWHIDLSKTGLEKESIRVTETGLALTEIIRRSRGFVDIWQNAMREPSGIDFHLLTLPEDQRKTIGDLLRLRPALGAVAGGAASCQGRPEIVAAFQRTCRGDCVQTEPGALLDEAEQKQIVDVMRSWFAPGPREQKQLKFNPGQSHPSRRIVGDRLQLSFDADIQLEEKEQGFHADIVLTFETNAAALHQDARTVPLDWRFVSLKLVGATTKPSGPP